MLDRGKQIDFEGPAGYALFGDGLFRRHRKSGWTVEPMPNPLLEWPIADSHAHLHMLADPSLTLARCAFAGVDFICSITDPSEDGWVTYDNEAAWRGEALTRLSGVYAATTQAFARYRRAMEDAGAPLPAADQPEEQLAFRCPCNVNIPRIRIAAGVHPHNARLWTDEVEAALRSQLADPRTAALGEVGLDYYYDKSPRDVQQDVFARQIAVAHETGLPLVLHIRDAHEDAFRILEEEGWPAAGTLLHCCSVGPDELGRWLDRGAYVAFGGAVTFARSDGLRASAALVPDGKLLVETDAPFMAPVPFRGLECAPEFTVYTAARLAEVRGAQPGWRRGAMLEAMYDATLELLDRGPTPWQRLHAR